MNTSNNEMPDDLREILQSARKLSEIDLTELGKAVRALDSDPVWRADYLKSAFVQRILMAMDQGGISQSEIAKRWGKTRQYVSKVLSENKRVNFTIETICQLSHLVKKKVLDIPLVDETDDDTTWSTPAGKIWAVKTGLPIESVKTSQHTGGEKWGFIGGASQKKEKSSVFPTRRFSDEELLAASEEYRIHSLVS